MASLALAMLLAPVVFAAVAPGMAMLCRLSNGMGGRCKGGTHSVCTDMPGGMAAACSGIEDSWSLCVHHNALCGQR